MKDKQSRICTICGARKYSTEEIDKIRDAIEFKHLIRVDEDIIKIYKALKHDDDDEIGALAQRCFHIEYVKKDDSYYHFLDYDESKSSNNMNQENKSKRRETNQSSLIENGEITKLPCCEHCYNKLSTVNKKTKTQNKESDLNVGKILKLP